MAWNIKRGGKSRLVYSAVQMNDLHTQSKNNAPVPSTKLLCAIAGCSHADTYIQDVQYMPYIYWRAVIHIPSHTSVVGF